MISFEKMPTWSIVAIATRIARLVQGAAVCRKDESERSAINAAIQIAEESARNALASEQAQEISLTARNVADAADRDSQPKASLAARCAAEAAIAVSVVDNKQELVASAERALKHARNVLKPELLPHFEEDIRQASELGSAVTDDASAPSEMFNVVHRQAVHEAGHAVAAALHGICFEEIRIIYDAAVDLTWNPIDHPADFSCEERGKFRLVYAAGAAAEELFYDSYQAWGCTDDVLKHSKCGGTDFTKDVAIVREEPWFDAAIIGELADELQKYHRLSDIQVEEFFSRHGIELYD